MEPESRQVVIVKNERPWGWICGTVLLICFMFFSLVSWAIDKALVSAEKSAERSHEMAMKAMNLAHETALHSAASSISPGMLLVYGMIGVGILIILKGLKIL
jgi:hypothetical protein